LNYSETVFEKSATKEAAKIAEVLEKFPISVWLLDENRNILYMNAEMKDLFGELTGENAGILFEESEKILPREKTEKGFFEIVLADVIYKSTSGKVQIEGYGDCRLETFEDISAERSAQRQNSISLARLKKDLAIAKRIQKSLLPANGVYGGTIEYNSSYIPADEVGGDFLDILPVGEGKYVLYVADVSGHGVQASLLTIFVREQIRAFASSSCGADEILKNLLRSYNALNIDTTIYLTALVCKYDSRTRELGVANAGHGCFPLIIRSGGRIETIPIKGMPISAISEEDSYEEELVRLDVGDRLILFTDGIVEEYDSVRGSALGADGLRAIAEAGKTLSGRALADLIMSESSTYAIGSAKDDRTIAIADIVG
jgi:sigma-B regulation protein RsbU (phosphoserine phosphatase)